MQRLLLTLFLLICKQVAVASIRRPQVTVVGGAQGKSHNDFLSPAQYAATSIPRGGFSLETTVAAAAATSLGLHGGVLVTNPKFALDKIYKMEPPKTPEDERLSKILVRNIGCASLGFATSVYLTMVQQMPMERAVAWGLLPRSLCFMSNLAFRIRPFQIFSLLLNFYGVVALNIKTPTYMITWRFLGGRTLLEGLSLVKWPRGAVKSMFGVNDETDYQRILARSLGNEVASGAAYIGWMVLGVNPTTSLALAGLQWIICAADTAWNEKVLKAKDNRQPPQIKQMIMAGLVTVGSFLAATLLKK